MLYHVVSILMFYFRYTENNIDLSLLSNTFFVHPFKNLINTSWLKKRNSRNHGGHINISNIIHIRRVDGAW